MSYFNRTGEATAMPKFVLYSAHAETVAPILHALQNPQLVTPPPASMVLVNYYLDTECAASTDDDCLRVVGSYVPHLRTMEEVDEIFNLSGS